MIDFLGRY